MMRAVALIVALLLSGCAATGAHVPVPPPTEAEALAHLGEVVKVVKSGDLAHLCDLGNGSCRQLLQKSDPATVPRTDPRVVGTKVIPYSDLGGGMWTDGGRVLMLCGRDGLGRQYYSEMLVAREDGRLVSTGTPYWIGMTIATDTATSASMAPAPECPST
jgi:hypothetical protein